MGWKFCPQYQERESGLVRQGKMVEVGPLSGRRSPTLRPGARREWNREAGAWPVLLTHKHRDQEPTDPLLLDLLDLSCSPWTAGFPHDCEGISVGNGTHSGGTEPGHPEEGSHPTHANDQQQVQVEAGSLDHLALGFADNQPRVEGSLVSWDRLRPLLLSPHWCPSEPFGFRFPFPFDFLAPSLWLFENSDS